MKVDYVDGIKVMKLSDSNRPAIQADDALTMLRLWQLLTGGNSLRDTQTIFNRSL